MKQEKITPVYLTAEQYLEKYDKYIRAIIYKRADSDYCDDAYQEVVMKILKYKERLDSLPNDNARKAYIAAIVKHTAYPSDRKSKKLTTYEDFTAKDDDSTAEEWLLSDDTLRPDNQVDFAKRAWAEEIIDTNERLKRIEKTLNKIHGNYYYFLRNKLYRLANKQSLSLYNKEYSKRHRDKFKEYQRNYYQRRKNEQLGNS